MLKVTGCVMSLAPIAVFAAMASIVTTQGLGILLTYGKFMAGFYFEPARPVGPARRSPASCSSGAGVHACSG